MRQGLGYQKKIFEIFVMYLDTKLEHILWWRWKQDPISQFSH